jgi:cytidylate kinase
MATKGFVVAIDGPAGSGKSTLARRLARELHLPYLNTGMMYRALAARALDRSVAPDDAPELERLTRTLSFAIAGNDPPELVIDGAPPTPSLTSPEVESIVSTVARHPGVREVMRTVQRQLGLAGSVMEGRDIGTVVFPDATVKIFLEAEPRVRAVRRERERGGGGDVAQAVGRRDQLDAKTNPLVPARDAHVIDTTVLGPEEVLAESLRLVEGR